MLFGKTSRRAAELFWRLVTGIVVTTFLLMLFVILLEIVARYVLRISVPWTGEASRYLYICAIFFGAAITQRSREHIRVTVLTDRLPVAARRIVMRISSFIVALLCVPILIGAVKMSKETYGINASAMPISFSWIYVVTFIGVLLLCLLALRDVIAPSLNQKNGK